jgi:ABC-type transport system involved in multi-copper enzyme maturation permease subunit
MKTILFEQLRILWALLLKDWRFFRVPVIALLILGGSCYLVARFTRGPRWAAPKFIHAFNVNPDLFTQAAESAVGIGALVAAAMGGMAIAGERADRTAEFTAMLPIPRWQIALSKSIVSVVVIALFAGIHVGIAHWICWYWGWSVPDEPYRLSFFAGVVVSMFGVAWLVGSMIRSPAISACIGIGVTIAIFLSIELASGEPRFSAWWLERAEIFTCSVFISALSLTVGTAIYLRRISP